LSAPPPHRDDFDYRASQLNASAPFVSMNHRPACGRACAKVADTAFAAELQQPRQYPRKTESDYHLISRRQRPHFGLLHMLESPAFAANAQTTGDSSRQSPSRQHH